jgi:hypothetical protein
MVCHRPVSLLLPSASLSVCTTGSFLTTYVPLSLPSLSCSLLELPQFIPGFYQTNSKGPDSNYNWGLSSVADFFQSTDRRVRSLAWEAKAAAAKAEDDAAAVEAAAVLEAETKAAKLLAESSVEESVVIVEPVDEVVFRPRGKKGKGQGGN